MAKCKVENCEKDTTSSKGAWGYCGKHAQRVRRYGNPDYITPESIRAERSRRSQPKLGKVKKTTYKKYRGRHEHRVIAESMLGRKLESWEHVHHIDGNKHNNDPKNLAVLTQIEHAKEHINERIATWRLKNQLSDEQIREIRKAVLPQSILSKIYQVSQSLISHIRARKIYRHVSDD